MPEKMEPCCARLTGSFHREENNLRVLAKKTAKRAEKGLDITQNLGWIADCRAAIAELKIRIEEHDADHAGRPV